MPAICYWPNPIISVEDDTCDYHIDSNARNQCNSRMPCHVDTLDEHIEPLNRRSFA